MTGAYRPGSEAELAAIVSESARTGRKLRILGSGTRTAGGGICEADATVSLSEMNGITLYEPAALTIGAKAGTPLAAIEAALAAEGQHLPFEPADWRPLLGSAGEPTIGGAYACGVSGPRRIQAGALRDSAIGIRFVDGAGTVVKNGGRVMKNVTGYDLVKLLCGAWGTLGVATEIVFKVLPRPETTATLVIEGLSAAAAVEAMSAALSSPFDVTGAAHLPGGQAQTLVRLEGFGKSVAYRAAELASQLGRFGAVEIAGAEQSGPMWQSVRDVLPFAGKDGAVWRISVQPSAAPGLVSAISDLLPVEVLFDWGGGLVWLLTPDEGDGGAAIIRGELARRGGHATLLRASSGTKRSVPVFQPQAAALARIQSQLAAKFDPHGVLNPGVMATGTILEAA